MNTVEKVEKVSKLFQPGTEWLYGYTKVAADYRLAQWAQVIEARLNSGQNIKDFCQTAGISRNAYFYWQKKLRKVACTELAKTEEPKDIVPSGWISLRRNRCNTRKKSWRLKSTAVMSL